MTRLPERVVRTKPATRQRRGLRGTCPLPSPLLDLPTGGGEKFGAPIGDGVPVLPAYSVLLAATFPSKLATQSTVCWCRTGARTFVNISNTGRTRLHHANDQPRCADMRVSYGFTSYPY